MGPDRYKVEVLHYLNPYLIWVEVLTVGENKMYHFAQIGIFGVLPKVSHINMEEGMVMMTQSDKWAPAANLVMQNLLKEAREVWFCPTFIHRKTSVFDNGIQKYGDLYINLKNGNKINISDELVDSKFAMYDESLFLQCLSMGTFKTKLDYITTIKVLKKLESCYDEKEKPKDLWLKSLKDQTKLFRAALDIESSIESRKLVVKNKDNVKQLLENKLNDLELCKDVEEASIGRASNVRQICSMSSQLSSVSLKKRLELLNTQKSDSQDSSFIMRKYFDNVSLISHTPGQEEKSFDDKEIERNTLKEDLRKDKKKSAPRVPTKKEEDPVKQCVAYGPPGLNPTKLKIKFVSKTKEAPEGPQPEPEKPEPDVVIDVKNDMCFEENSEVKINITNLNVLKTIRSAQDHNSAQNGQIHNHVKKPSSLQRKLRYLQDKASGIHDDSTTTGSDNSIEFKNNDSDDESVTDLVAKLNLSPTKKVVEVKSETVIDDRVKNNVNPFKNVDGSISVFVDKLVSPILMVHTKKNNRFEPHYNLRDVPFGTDIHIVLRNMSVTNPMRLQTISWPTILRGHSLFLVSPSASGKTMGYLPAVCRLVADNKQISDGIGPSCIIVCATSKSVSDVEKNCRMFLHDVRIFACYAGVDDIILTTSILNGCDLLICTPCLLVRLLQKDIGVDLRNLSTFVLDDCERLSEVYLNELKFSLHKVKQMLQVRANKVPKVQYVVASRIWCDFMTPLAKKAPDSVICIGAFQECVLYSKCCTSVNFVKQNNKVNAVINFLKDIDISKKTVIACRSDDEVKLLEETLTKLNYTVFACDSTMTVHDLYKLDLDLNEYQDPLLGAILVCCDSNLIHLNVTNAYYLIHYSLPELFSMFCKRFAVLIDNYPSVFKNDEGDIKIKILLEDTNIEQLPKILNFIERCTTDIPAVLDEISEKVLLEKDLVKAQKLVPLCNNLLRSGKCPDLWNCKERHNIFKEYDEPKEWLPRDGVVTFRILHYHTAVSYSARLISNISNGSTKRFPQAYSSLTLKMAMYFSKEDNKKLHGIPAVGDICAVALKQCLFVRCQVAKILRYSRKGTPHLVLIKLLDEEKYEMTRDIHLYHLPDKFKDIETYVVRVELSNIQPEDRDITFSDLAKNQLKKITDKNDDQFMRGHVSLVLGNYIFVDTLEACQELSSLREIVVKSDFRKELLDGHAIPNPDHIPTLIELCKDVTPVSKEEVKVIEVAKPLKTVPEVRWAHLERDDYSSVLYASAESPEKFFIRLVKFRDCLDILINDIRKYVADSSEPLDDINVGDIVLAEFPDDGMYERARIDAIVDDRKVKCFFVDQGDWREVYTKNLKPIIEKFITQLPFQAIECRLVGIKPAGNKWTELSTNWFVDACFDSDSNLKHLFVKYFTTEIAECTEGSKYGVVLIDTYSKNDVIINNLMIYLNLARENHEVKFLDENNLKREAPKPSDNDTDDDEIPEVPERCTKELVEDSKNTGPLQDILLKQPIRSVPLSAFDDSDASDKWDFNVTDDFMPNFKPLTNSEIDSDTTVKKINNLKALPPITGNSTLDSDDFSSSECSDKITSPKNNTVLSELRKPKLFWRQNKNTVTIKVQLIGAKNYEIIIKERFIKFFANVNDINYGFEFELYGGINCQKSSHSNKGLYILVTLSKIMQRNWLTLTKGGALTKWIVYDLDGINISSDEEVEVENNLKNIIKIDDGFVTDSDDDLLNVDNFN